MFTFPRYRYLTQKFNFDDYASKGSAVHAAKKLNRAIADRGMDSDEGKALVLGKCLVFNMIKLISKLQECRMWIIFERIRHILVSS